MEVSFDPPVVSLLIHRSENDKAGDSPDTQNCEAVVCPPLEGFFWAAAVGP